VKQGSGVTPRWEQTFSRAEWECARCRCYLPPHAPVHLYYPDYPEPLRYPSVMHPKVYCRKCGPVVKVMEAMT
jgi:hypothetical protein